MRISVLALAFALFALPAAAADIPAEDAGAHIGETATVVGVLTGVHKAKNNIYLDMGGSYPDNAFSGIIFVHTRTPPDFSQLVGRTIGITGKIKNYHGKPEIIIDSADQVKVAR